MQQDTNSTDLDRPTVIQRIFRPSTLIAVGVVVVSMLIFSALKATKPDAQIKASEEPAFSVQAIEVHPAPRQPELVMYGRVSAPVRSTLSAAISADVAEVHKRAGSRADTDELMIRLDPAEAEIAHAQSQADLQQAESSLRIDQQQRRANQQSLHHERELLRLAERAVARSVKLRQQGSLSEAQLDQNKQNLQRQKLAVEQRELAVQQADAVSAQKQAQLRIAEARLQRAELDLQRSEIRAPYPAHIIQTLVSPGDRVTPGKPLLEIFDRSQQEIQAQVPNRYVPVIRQALSEQKALQAIIQQGSQRIRTQLVRLAASGGKGGQTAYFHLEPKDADELAVDSNVSLRLQLPPQEQAVALPFQAIYDLSRIFRVRDNRLEALRFENLGDYQNPETGRAEVLIRSPQLASGDQVVLTQLPNAVTGLKVQLIQP